MTSQQEATDYFYYLHQYYYDQQDPRTQHLPLITIPPYAMFLLMSSYLLLSTKVTPYLMKNRPAFQLRKIMFIYNISMVLANFYFFCLILPRLNFGWKLLEFEYPSRDVNTLDARNDINLGKN